MHFYPKFSFCGSRVCFAFSALATALFAFVNYPSVFLTFQRMGKSWVQAALIVTKGKRMAIKSYLIFAFRRRVTYFPWKQRRI